MNRMIALLALGATAACSSVKLVQREGCWVRRTERLGSVKEDLGPCTRKPPEWADDRITRVVQECVAQDDYRWQSRAMAAWSRGGALPDRPPEEAVLKACLDESARTALSENERLQARLDELAGERAALAARVADDRTHLLTSYDRIAGDLGEAAKKPQPPASATATATTTASADGEVSGTTGAPPRTTVAAAAPSTSDAPGAAPARRSRVGPRASRARAPHCEPTAATATVASPPPAAAATPPATAPGP